MKKLVFALFLVFLFTLIIYSSIPHQAHSLFSKYLLIEDFDNTPPEFSSWRDWDLEPNAWEITENFGYNTSSSLHLVGQCAKKMALYPVKVDKGDVWQAAAYFTNNVSVAGIGFYDDFNVLLYSLSGSECLEIDEWVTCYQGIYNQEEWHEINLPIAADWEARYGYLPRIKGIVFISNGNSGGHIYFDEIQNMTSLLPQPPTATIDYEITGERSRVGGREVSVHFTALAEDPDSDSLSYCWLMGDTTRVELAEFDYTYTFEDDHDWSVSLTVVDDTGLECYASCRILPDEGESSFPLSLNFVGDIMFAREIGDYISVDGFEGLMDPTAALLGEGADLTIANLECPLTDSNNHHPTKTIYFKGETGSAVALSYAGIDLVTLANNHILDYMEEGITDTQLSLQDAGVLYSGAGFNSYEAYRPLLVTRKGVSMAFLASSDRTGQYNNYQPYLNAGYNKSGFAYLTKYYMGEQIAEVRDVSDLVIMELHCGSEYSTEPGSNYDALPGEWYMDENPEDEGYSWRNDVPQAWDMEYRHYAVDAGADLVICHHPHIVQGFEAYNGKLIAHSLGNFIFDLSYPETFPTCILYSEIDEGGFCRHYIKACYIDDDITVPAQGELALYILDHLAAKSRDLQTFLYVNKEELCAEIIMDPQNMQIYSAGFVKTAELQEREGYYSTGPMLLERYGSISSLNTVTPAGNWEFRVGREIIYHGNFEDEGCSEWNVNSSHETITTEQPFAGSNCLLIDLDSAAGDNIITNLEGRIKLYDDVDYSLHGYIKTSFTNDAEIQIRTYSSRTGGDYINQYGTPGLNGTNDWTYVWQDLPELDEDASFIDFRSTIYPPEEGYSWGRFDNVGLIGWEEWQTFDGTPVEIQSPNEYYYLELRNTEEIDEIEYTYLERNYGFPPPMMNDMPEAGLPRAQLMPNYPNPFNPSTVFRFELLQPAESAVLKIFNIKGQIVNELPVDITRGSGVYETSWNGQTHKQVQAASGVYLYQLNIDDKPVSEGKCILMK